MRATAGAIFRLPVLRGDAASLLALGFELWVADAAGEPVSELAERPARLALAVGNEPHGVDGGLKDAAHRTVGIPLARTVESLNVAVAAGILLHALGALPVRRTTRS